MFEFLNREKKNVKILFDAISRIFSNFIINIIFFFFLILLQPKNKIGFEKKNCEFNFCLFQKNRFLI